MSSTNGIALNVTRTRVTVLVFNLTVICVMLSILVAGRENGEFGPITHLTTFVALFVGFCLTILGLFWLLSSQRLDAQGLSHPRPFALGTITTYLSLSQTITAFMHEYLVGFKSAADAALPGVAEGARTGILPDALGDIVLLVLLVMGGGIWVLTTYIAPLRVCFRISAHHGHLWLFVAYYFVLLVPVYWVYSKAWHLQYAPADHSMDMLLLFVLQFVQPLLWFR